MRVLCAILIAVLPMPVSAWTQQAQPLLDNHAVVKMVEAKVPADMIIRAIEEAPEVHFSVYPADLIALKQWGVSDDIIRAMAARQAGRLAPTAPAQAPTITPRAVTSAPAPASLAKASAEAPTASPQEPEYIAGGMWELGFEGSLFVPHAHAADVFGLVGLRAGRFVTDGNEVGVDTTLFLHRRVQDIYLAGFYRYNFHTANPRLFPFLGAGAGVNVFVGGGEAASNFLARGEFGLKYFLAQKVAFELAYNLVYVDTKKRGFKDSSSSVVTVGLAYVF